MLGVGLVAVAACLTAAVGYDRYEADPIYYSTAPVDDPVARLQARLDKGEAQLSHDPQFGYLKSLLDQLKVPASSQTLVFSKTSFQRDKIAPHRPRALYFNDGVYIGFADGGDMIEVASADPKQGTIFYTLDQTRAERPRFVRQTDSCLQCHGGSMTRDVPGLLIRSVLPDKDGQPLLSAGSSMTTHESPLAERWGGWYVTGTHGSQSHMGNVVAADEDNPTLPPGGTNVTSLSGKFDTSKYLNGHSDIVALMVLEHQGEMHNRLTRANYLTRTALRDEAAIGQALGHPADAKTHTDGTRRRIKSACEPVVEYMLFAGEAALTAPVQGTSDFTKEFPQAGPRDDKGRSLRDLDLQRRLFKYPCSYLIYSEAFDGLPDAAREYIYGRLLEVLIGEDISRTFAHLSKEDRCTILDILRQTKPGLPEAWKTASW